MRVAVVHDYFTQLGGAERVAEELMRQVRAHVQPATAFVGSFSPVMVAHTGPGLAGLAWWWEDKSAQEPDGPGQAGAPGALSGSGGG